MYLKCETKQKMQGKKIHFSKAENLPSSLNLRRDIPRVISEEICYFGACNFSVSDVSAKCYCGAYNVFLYFVIQGNNVLSFESSDICHRKLAYMFEEQ